MRSLLRSMPSLFLNSAMIHSMIRWSRLSPPRCVSPLVALTSTTPFADFEDRDVERAAAEVVDGDRLVLLLVEPVGQRRGRRLVDDAHHLEAGDAARFLGGLALRVVEVGGNGDDGLGDRLTEVLLGRLLQLLQDHRGDLRRRVLLVHDLDAHVAVGGRRHRVRHHLHFFVHFVEAPAHEPLDREDGVLGVRHRLPLGDLPDEPFAGLGERDHGGRDAAAFGVGDDDGLAAFHDGHHGVGGAEIDADDFAHVVASFARSVGRRARASARQVLGRFHY